MDSTITIKINSKDRHKLIKLYALLESNRIEHYIINSFNSSNNTSVSKSKIIDSKPLRIREFKKRSWSITEDLALSELYKIPRGKKRSKALKKLSKTINRTVGALHKRMYKIKRSKT